MPATITFTRPSFTDIDSLPSATFNGVAVVSGTVPDAEAGAYGVMRLAGDLTGTASAPVLTATGATAGSYGVNVLAIPQLTVDAKGRITAVADRALGTAYGKTVIESADAAGARAVLVLGDVATRNVGTTGGTAAAGDDSRFTNSRRCNGTFDDAATARTALGLGDVATRNVGTTPGTAAAGDDARLSNSRQCNNSFDNPATARTALGLGSLASAQLFTSSPQAFPALPATIQVSHGLGRLPFMAWAVIRCISAEYGYAVGDEVPYGRTTPVTEQGNAYWNTSVVGVRQHAQYPVICRRDADAWAVLTAAKWNVVFYAF